MRRLILLLLCALLVTACGGGSSKRLSRKQYAQRADAICARYNKQSKAFGAPTTLTQLAVTADKTVTLLDKATADFRKLRPPQDEQQLVNRWLTTLSQLRDDVVKLGDRAKAKDLLGVRQLVAPAQLHDRESNQVATLLGMHVCNTQR